MFEPLVGILEEASIDALRDPRAHTQVVLNCGDVHFPRTFVAILYLCYTVDQIRVYPSHPSYLFVLYV